METLQPQLHGGHLAGLSHPLLRARGPVQVLGPLQDRYPPLRHRGNGGALLPVRDRPARPRPVLAQPLRLAHLASPSGWSGWPSASSSGASSAASRASSAGSSTRSSSGIIEFLISIPTHPAVDGPERRAAARNGRPTLVYFGITIILSIIGWTGLARVVRGKILALREEDFVMAAKVSGSTPWNTIIAPPHPVVPQLPHRPPHPRHPRDDPRARRR